VIVVNMPECQESCAQLMCSVVIVKNKV